MRKSYTDPSESSVMADPPRSVGKITISKGGNTDLTEFNLQFTLKFEGPTPVFVPPVAGDIVRWERTPLGIANGYPEQDEAYPVSLVPSQGVAPGEILFVGAIDFRPGDGTGNGVMYTAEIEVSGFPASNRTDVDIIML